MSSASRSDLRILVADDNRDAALALAMLLDRLGFQVIATEFDGESALARIRREGPNVAILDIALPEMDGCEIARQVREELSDPPRLVAVTGLGSTADRCDAIEAGFDSYFVKPVDSRRLEELLLGYLS
jgi:DNA-binding response OmpR family regulator